MVRYVLILVRDAWALICASRVESHRWVIEIDGRKDARLTENHTTKRALLRLVFTKTLGLLPATLYRLIPWTLQIYLLDMLHGVFLLTIDWTKGIIGNIYVLIWLILSVIIIRNWVIIFCSFQRLCLYLSRNILTCISQHYLIRIDIRLVLKYDTIVLICNHLILALNPCQFMFLDYFFSFVTIGIIYFIHCVFCEGVIILIFLP